MVLNDDAKLKPGFGMKLSGFLNECPHQIGMISAVMWQTDFEVIHSAGLCLTPNGFGNRSQFFGRTDLPKKQFVLGPCGAAAIYRRQCLDLIGRFPEDFFFMFEDWEVALRIQAIGFDCLLLPELQGSHVGSATLKSFASKRVFESAKNWLCAAARSLPDSYLCPQTLCPHFWQEYYDHQCALGWSTELEAARDAFFRKKNVLLEARKQLQSIACKDWENRLERIEYKGEIQITNVNRPSNNE